MHQCNHLISALKTMKAKATITLQVIGVLREDTLLELRNLKHLMSLLLKMLLKDLA